MTSGDNPMSADARDRGLAERHGVVVVRADQYHVDGYRYTNLADAMAQAQRRTAASGMDG